MVLHFVEEFSAKYGLHKTVSEHTIVLLRAYDWTGNVRRPRNGQKIAPRRLNLCSSRCPQGSHDETASFPFPASRSALHIN
jgi:transcriptional regulator with GAF, ATPase, and Fis domain